MHSLWGEEGGGGGCWGKGMFFKGENYFHIPPYHTEFFGIPLLLTTLVFRRKVKYGQYDEMINV